MTKLHKRRESPPDCDDDTVRQPSKAVKDPEQTLFLPLISKEEITSNIRKFRFALPSSDDVLGLLVGQHIELSATINGEQVSRSYTPISSDADSGYVELISKIFRSDKRVTFSQFLDEMQIGEKIAVRGPCGKTRYLGRGCFLLEREGQPPELIEQKKLINMLAVDGGICPMMQIIRSVLDDSSDDTKINLVYLSDEHIMLKNELDELALKHPRQLTISYIGEDNSLATIFQPSDEVITLACPI